MFIEGGASRQRALIAPLFVATVQRPPCRAIDWTRPTPGTRSPVETPIKPAGPCKIALPLTTSRTTQLGIFFVSMGPCGFNAGEADGVDASIAADLAGAALVATAGAGGRAITTVVLRSIRSSRSFSCSSLFDTSPAVAAA